MFYEPEDMMKAGRRATRSNSSVEVNSWLVLLAGSFCL